MNSGEITIICYADDAIIVSEGKNNLQSLPYTSHTISKQFKMQISLVNTKSVVLSMEPLRGKLVVEDKLVEQLIFGVNFANRV